jgi:hypothetical protein
MMGGSKDPATFAERRLGLGVDPRTKLGKIIPELERESVILLPTDTIYGISCRWDSQAARDRIQRLKGPERLAFFVSLIADREMAFRYAEQPSLECLEVLESAWPGPVTAILKLRPNAAPQFCGSPEGTIAFRLPESAFRKSWFTEWTCRSCRRARIAPESRTRNRWMKPGRSSETESISMSMPDRRRRSLRRSST